MAAVIFGALPARAEARLVLLHAPETLVKTGSMQHILPRFSLKTRLRVEFVSEATGLFSA